MKRYLPMVVTLAMFASVLAGCGGGKESDKSGSSSGAASGGSSSKNATLKIFTSKVELSEQFNRLKTDYEKEHPGVKLQIEWITSENYDTQLKAKFASGEMPDIFNNVGFSQKDVWLEHMEDLSDQPWVKDELPIAKDPMTKDGKIYGMPMNLESLGIIYNKDLFTKAGITDIPKTYTELKTVVDKLNAAKIQPFVTSYQTWFGLGYHFMNNAFAKQPDPNAFIDGLNKGTETITTNKIFEDWVKLFDLFVQNGDPKPLSVDRDTGFSEFGAGKAAMIMSGNYLEAPLKQMKSTVNAGVMPIPLNDDAALNDKIFVSPPTNWVVYKDSPVKEQAKEFLNWLVTSKTGQHYITEEFQFIPAFQSIKVSDGVMGPLSQDTLSYVKQGKVLGWYFSKFPAGAGQQFGSAMQKHIAGNIDGKQMLEEIQAAWNSTKAK
ncbi:ABC transporter substrate-binding protein [Paenibacillus rigui]|uniref:ABC transporter substrate-binding protein n=1 Tax=Paenibacillus rigui TaxID=554312 RepID=A0A229UGT3_9BACL|nr:extracellular solute-binding protein [Paenibacillus rigui]OXM82571.1 ABC transporter substrate-binding protein [Paenibacillus rigui]